MLEHRIRDDEGIRGERESAVRIKVDAEDGEKCERSAYVGNDRCGYEIADLVFFDGIGNLMRHHERNMAPRGNAKPPGDKNRKKHARDGIVERENGAHIREYKIGESAEREYEARDEEHVP